MIPFLNLKVHSFQKKKPKACRPLSPRTLKAIHKYVEEKRIKYPDQQLLCIAPSTVTDTKMTLRRKDKKNVLKSINQNPKKRGIKAYEISNLIYNIFYKTTDYITNVVIKVDGGKFSRM